MKTNIILASLAITAMLLSGCSESAAAADNTVKNTSGTAEASSSSGADTFSGDVSDKSSSDMFSERDMKQNADLSSAERLTVKDGKTLDITKEGVYVISGTASDCTIKINVSKKEKVQLVLDGVSITNKDFACIYVKSADKVFITSADGESSLSVTDDFVSDGNTKVDAAIFSKDDLTLNGTGTLRINSSGNGISCKDDMKITGGSYDVTSKKSGFEAKKSLYISDGSFTVNSEKDAFRCKDSDDASVGEIYIAGGSFGINASDNGIRGTTTVTIDGGDIDIKASEGIEGTYITINGGTVSIEASDDGINASRKSKADDLKTAVEINGGDITIVMGAGDTDGIDANGSIYVNGGTVSITGISSFDYDDEGILNGGTVYVNGEQVYELPNQTFGPGVMGGGKGKFQDGNFFGGNFPDMTPPDGDFSGFTPPDGDFSEFTPPDGDFSGMTPPDGDFRGGKFRDGEDGRRGKFNKNGENGQSGQNGEASDASSGV